MQLFVYTYQTEAEVDEQGAENAWRYTAIIFHNSQDDAQAWFSENISEACNIEIEEVIRPEMWLDVWSE